MKYKFAGFTLDNRHWPTITVNHLKTIGISPTALWKEFQPASLEQTPIGNRTKIGFYLDTGTSRRPLCIRNQN